jgi:hypothetical protein
MTKWNTISLAPETPPGGGAPDERAQAMWAAIVAEQERSLEYRNKELKRLAEERQELTELRDTYKEFNLDQREILKMNLDLRQREVRELRKAAQVQRANLDDARQEHEARRKEIEEHDKSVARRIAKLKELGLVSKPFWRDQQKQWDKQLEIWKQQEKEAHQRDRAEKATRNLVARTQTLVETTLGVSDAWEKTLVGGILLADDPMEDIAETLGTMLTPANVLMSTFQKILEVSMLLVVQTDKLRANLVAVAGVEDGFLKANEIWQSHTALIQYGVSIEEAYGAHTELRKGMSAFSLEGKANQKVLRDQVSLLNEVGVSMTTSTKIMDFFSRGLKMSTSQIKSTTAELHDLAMALKVPPQVIMEDFAAATSELAKYGAEMTHVFRGLEIQSKNTGLAVSELLSIAKKFDTFEAAGDTVGRLNALLGGPYLNSIQMLYAEEDERIELLRESIQLSGRQFDQLERFEKQAIASAAGISDMGTAMKLFGGTDATFRQQIANQESLAARAKEAQAATEQLMQIWQSLAISLQYLLYPVKLLLGLVTTITGAFDGLGGRVLGFVLAAKVATMAVGKLGTAKKIYLGVQGLMSKGLTKLIAQQTVDTATKGADAVVTGTLGQAEAGLARLQAARNRAFGVGVPILGADTAGKIANAGATGILTTAVNFLNSALGRTLLVLGAVVGGFMLGQKAAETMGSGVSQVIGVLLILAGALAAVAVAQAFASAGTTSPAQITGGLAVAGSLAGMGIGLFSGGSKTAGYEKELGMSLGGVGGEEFGTPHATAAMASHQHGSQAGELLASPDEILTQAPPGTSVMSGNASRQTFRKQEQQTAELRREMRDNTKVGEAQLAALESLLANQEEAKNKPAGPPPQMVVDNTVFGELIGQIVGEKLEIGS